MSRVALIGDVGGCADELRAALDDLPDDPDTTVVQVGDLVDRGPDSDGVLDVVAERLPSRRWIQLIGNHEWQYLGGELFWRSEPIGPLARQRLEQWWLAERIRVAAAIRTVNGDEYLVTHAGLTVASWRALGGPVTATTAADLLNTRPEALLNDFDGPLWTEANTLYESWLAGDEPVPFGQIHGHSQIVDFGRRSWQCSERIRRRATADWDARHTTTRISVARFHGIDPKHGTTGAPSWAPLILEGATLLS